MSWMHRPWKRLKASLVNDYGEVGSIPHAKEGKEISKALGFLRGEWDRVGGRVVKDSMSLLDDEDLDHIDWSIRLLKIDFFSDLSCPLGLLGLWISGSATWHAEVGMFWLE